MSIPELKSVRGGKVSTFLLNLCSASSRFSDSDSQLIPLSSVSPWWLNWAQLSTESRQIYTYKGTAGEEEKQPCKLCHFWVHLQMASSQGPVAPASCSLALWSALCPATLILQPRDCTEVGVWVWRLVVETDVFQEVWSCACSSPLKRPQSQQWAFWTCPINSYLFWDRASWSWHWPQTTNYLLLPPEFELQTRVTTLGSVTP